MQDEYRKRLKEYIARYGIKQIFVAKYMGISVQYLNNWLHSRYDMHDSHMAEIDSFINGDWMNG